MDGPSGSVGVGRGMKAFLRGRRNKDYNEAEVLVREATSNDPVGAMGEFIEQLVAAVRNQPELYTSMFQMIWKRIMDVKHHLHVVKALKLLQFLLAHPLLKDRLIRDCRSRVHNLKSLRDKYEYSSGQTKGGSVRQAAGELVEDLQEAIRDYDIRNPEDQEKSKSKSKSKSRKRNDDVLRPVDSGQMQKLFEDSSFQQPPPAADFSSGNIDSIFDMNEFAQAKPAGKEADLFADSAIPAEPVQVPAVVEPSGMTQAERDRIREENWARQKQKRQEERERHEAYLKRLEEKRLARERERRRQKQKEASESLSRKAGEDHAALLEKCLIELHRLENLGRQKAERVFQLKGRAIRKAMKHISSLEKKQEELEEHIANLGMQAELMRRQRIEIQAQQSLVCLQELLRLQGLAQQVARKKSEQYEQEVLRCEWLVEQKNAEILVLKRHREALKARKQLLSRSVQEMTRLEGQGRIQVTDQELARKRQEEELEELSEIRATLEDRVRALSREREEWLKQRRQQELQRQREAQALMDQLELESWMEDLHASPLFRQLYAYGEYLNALFCETSATSSTTSGSTVTKLQFESSRLAQSPPATQDSPNHVHSQIHPKLRLLLLSSIHRHQQASGPEEATRSPEEEISDVVEETPANLTPLTRVNRASSYTSPHSPTNRVQQLTNWDERQSLFLQHFRSLKSKPEYSANLDHLLPVRKHRWVPGGKSSTPDILAKITDGWLLSQLLLLIQSDCLDTRALNPPSLPSSGDAAETSAVRPGHSPNSPTNSTVLYMSPADAVDNLVMVLGTCEAIGLPAPAELTASKILGLIHGWSENTAALATDFIWGVLRSLLSRRLTMRNYNHQAKAPAPDAQARSLVRACQEAGLLEEDSIESTKWLPAEDLLQIWFGQKVDDLASADLIFDPAEAFGMSPLPESDPGSPGGAAEEDEADEEDPFHRVSDLLTVLFDLWRLQSKVYAYTNRTATPQAAGPSQASRLEPCVCGFEPPSPALVLQNHTGPSSALRNGEDRKQRLLFMSAEYAVVLAESLGIKFLISPEDIIEGQERLNFAFLADAYNKFAELEQELLQYEPDELTSEAGQAPKQDVSEAVAFANWINSLRLAINLEDSDGIRRSKKIAIRDLNSEMKDGLALLALLDHIQPGIVNWRNVELPKPVLPDPESTPPPQPKDEQLSKLDSPKQSQKGVRRRTRRAKKQNHKKKQRKDSNSEASTPASRSKTTAPYLTDDNEERKPLTRIQSVNNCNYGVKLCKQLGMSLVNVGGVDLNDGIEKLTLAVVWQVMRAKLIMQHQKQTAASPGPSSPSSNQGVNQSDSEVANQQDDAFEQALIAWCNEQVLQSPAPPGARAEKTPPAPQIRSLTDPQLSDGIYFLRLLSRVPALRPQAKHSHSAGKASLSSSSPSKIAIPTAETNGNAHIPLHQARNRRSSVRSLVNWDVVHFPQARPGLLEEQKNDSPPEGDPAAAAAAGKEAGMASVVQSLRSNGGRASDRKPGSGLRKEEQLKNCAYSVSLARKIGARVFCRPSDIAARRPRMVLTLLASIREASLGSSA